jgi:tRNA A-37 threonylcarbamoyl transferase component Bud32
MEIETFKGWSGSEVLRIGNRIHKTDKNVQHTLQWYEYYAELLNTPKVLAVTGDELVLQYIQPVQKATIDDAFDMLGLLVDLSDDYTPPQNYTWADYVARIGVHVRNIYTKEGVSLNNILPQLSGLHPVHSLSHGDLTPDNLIIGRNDRIWFIDPIANTYSSHELDRAKLIAWCITHHTDGYKINNGVHTWEDMLVGPLVISELIRTIPYAPLEFKNKLIPICLNYLNN